MRRGLPACALSSKVLRKGGGRSFAVGLSKDHSGFQGGQRWWEVSVARLESIELLICRSRWYGESVGCPG